MGNDQIIAEARRLCTEIGLQTYGRKPHEMNATADWQKLQMAEAMARQVRSLLEGVK
jgi:hypothetical protein